MLPLPDDLREAQAWRPDGTGRSRVGQPGRTLNAYGVLAEVDEPLTLNRSARSPKRSEEQLTQQYSQQVIAFARAASMQTLPDVVDVSTGAPANPPEEIQVKFVGLSYETAYAEAETFVKVCDEFASKHGRGSLATLDRLIDFGSGWGRITRTLLVRAPAYKIHALDVDQQMTALLNTTLPGVNALTIAPEPPTILGDATVNAVLAFSVFSHLSGPAHEAWAGEIGRLVAPGGVVAITVLDQAFFGQIAGAQRAVEVGEADAFAKDLAKTFPDLRATQAGYDAGKIQYAASGGGEMRTGDYYGWAAAPSQYIDRVWGAAGFRVVEWVRSGILFPQALVFMVRETGGDHIAHSVRTTTQGMAGRATRRARATAVRLRAKLPRSAAP